MIPIFCTIKSSVVKLGQGHQIPFCKTLLNMLNIKHNQNPSFGSGETALKPIFCGDLENEVKVTKFLATLKNLLIMLNAKHYQIPLIGFEETALKPIF